MNELTGSIVVVENLERPEDLMIHLASIARKIINDEPLDDIRQPTVASVRMQAAKMTLAYLALLS